MTEQSHCGLQRGQYLGEISALCFLHLPPHFSSLPFLLAGTGSQIIAYDLMIGKMIKSFDVFDGIRVHGISLQPFNEHVLGSHVTFNIVVYGERRVKLFSLQIRRVSDSQTVEQACLELSLSLVLLLPKFSHWVLDVSFLKWDGATCSNNGGDCLAIGCSDNSVHIWDTLRCSLLSRVGCSERCLLYSMRIWGDDVGSLHVASGTIFNEVIVWKVGCKADPDVIGNPTEDLLHLTTYEGLQLPYQQYEAVNICKLTGHEGSIFRLAWSADGIKLVSVSDDRSARIWTLGTDGPNHVVSFVLFGHNARIWDCCIFDSLIITAGEDCTCRVWGMDGTELTRIREHVGRGIWRCLYDPDAALLVTAGFDSAIKVHQLHASCSNGSEGGIVEVQDSTVQKEEFVLYIPNFREHVGVMNSKSEYVRCLHFSKEDSLYVATNNGYVYHAKLCETEDVKWTEILHIGEEGPIICMDLLSHCSNITEDVENWVAVGNGKGTMVIARVVGDVLNPRVDLTSTWSAEPERQLLGTYWCKSLGPMFLFTSDPRGTLKLWRLFNPMPSDSQDVMRRCAVSLIAEFRSCFGMRIMCLDASVENEVLVCGDIRGNLLLFPLQRDILFSMSASSKISVTPLSNFKGAHGISTVCSTSVASITPTQLEIHSTGGDGCICYFEHDRSRHNLEFVGIKQVKELSTVQSLTNADQQDNLPSTSCAIGFSSSDFIIWNLISETKVLQVTCGGWRRPHSYFLGDVPERKNCFAYVKDGIIYVCRHWLTTSERVMYPKNLHLQFHGREIHTLCFIAQDSPFSLKEKQDTSSQTMWVATGCEDGSVRLTRYDSETGNWSTSKLLGEHVGGSAVRSIFFVSRLHRMVLDANDVPDSVNSEYGFLVDPEDLSLLISVGAKRVVTAWKQKSKIRIREGTLDPECNTKIGFHLNGSLSSESFISTSFQWLSTDMPTRERNHGKQQNNQKVSEMVENGGSFPSEDKRSYSEESEPCIPDICENDWRYLAVTAFLVQVAGTRCSVCFIVVACSDATVTVRALLLPYRLWYDVALLTPLSSPVLALQHIVVPTYLKGNIQCGSRYIIISGSTDGNIAIWDLTEHVENFMRKLSVLQIGKGLDSQKRPRTGRGSQGGRQWRSLGSQVSNKITGNEQLSGVPISNGKPDNGLCATTVPGTDKNVQHHDLRGISHLVETTHPVSQDTSTGIKEVLHKVWPLHVFKDVHQSGVNCLHVSDIRGSKVSDQRFTFYVLSGGDDQSLNCLKFDFSPNSMRQSSESSTLEQHSTSASQSLGGRVHHHQVENYDIRFMLLDKIISAHSSAVKGVWTDGFWVFSTGLDQRIRCWHLEQQGKLTEHKHMVVSVPEPEALEARACGRNHYQIAVAGRGMQMFDFVAPDDMKGGN